MTPEGRILAFAKREAKRLGLRFVRLAQMPGVEAGWPDSFVLGEGGKVLWLELKAPGKPLRPLQSHRRKEIEDRGGLYAKGDSEDSVRQAMKGLKGAV